MDLHTLAVRRRSELMEGPGMYSPASLPPSGETTVVAEGTRGGEGLSEQRLERLSAGGGS